MSQRPNFSSGRWPTRQRIKNSAQYVTYTGLAAWRVTEGNDRENRIILRFYLDIAPDRDVKKKSLDEHKSQGPEEIWQVHERMHRRRGAQCGVEFAEAYKLVEAKEGCPLLPVSFLPRKGSNPGGKSQ